MAITVTHAKVSGVSDGADAAQVQPSDWNDGHVVGGTIDVPDPLTIGVINITDHESFGANPAESGRIRLSNNEAIMARNAADDGDVELFRLGAVTSIPDATIALGGRIAWGIQDGGDGSRFHCMDSTGEARFFQDWEEPLGGGDLSAADWGQADALGNQRLLIGYSEDNTYIIVSRPGNAEMFKFSSDEDGARLALNHTAAFGVFFESEFNDTLNNHLFALQQLPLVDPDVAGQVFTMDSGGLAAALAAGARYLLISDGP